MKTLEINPETQKALIIKRTFNIPLSTVWKAWSEEKSFKKWWGPNGYSCPECSIDFRKGGKYLACMKGPDGKENWLSGVYQEIIPMKKIVYTDYFSDDKGNKINASDLGMPGNWPSELLVTLEFEEKAGKTTMNLQHEGIPAEMYDDCIQGWQECFDKLEKNL